MAHHEKKPPKTLPMEVKTSKSPHWKRMWVILEGTILKFSSTLEGPSKKINLDKSVSILEKPIALTSRKYCFEISQKRSLGRLRSYLFALSTKEEFKDWMETIGDILQLKRSEKRESKSEESEEGSPKKGSRHSKGSKDNEDMRKKLEDIKAREMRIKSVEIMTPTKPSKRIGDYFVGKTLGEGTFGKVKMGTHVDTGAEVALKFVEKSSLSSSREINIMTCLNHANIVKLYEVIDVPEKNATCLVLEYVEGGELFNLIVELGSLPETEARKLFRQIVSAIEYMHKNLVIHRDLKPENILLDEDLNVKITDFGLANLMKPGSFLKSHCGSMHYTPPEMHYGDNYIGPEIDMWAMGVTLYAMVIGCLPWKGDSLQEQMENLIIAKYVVPPKISETCKHLIGRLLTIDPKQRATVEEIRRHPWVNEGCSEPPVSYSQPRKPLTITDIDNEIVVKMKDIGFEVSEVVTDLKANATAKQTVIVYYLMADNKKMVELQPSKMVKATPTVKNFKNITKA